MPAPPATSTAAAPAAGSPGANIFGGHGGLTGVLAPELTRRRRRPYAACAGAPGRPPGARAVALLRSGDHWMGDEFDTRRRRIGCRLCALRHSRLGRARSLRHRRAACGGATCTPSPGYPTPWSGSAGAAPGIATATAGPPGPGRLRVDRRRHRRGNALGRCASRADASMPTATGHLAHHHLWLRHRCACCAWPTWPVPGWICSPPWSRTTSEPALTLTRRRPDPRRPPRDRCRWAESALRVERIADPAALPVTVDGRLTLDLPPPTARSTCAPASPTVTRSGPVRCSSPVAGSRPGMTPTLRCHLTRRLHIDLQRVIAAACPGFA